MPDADPGGIPMLRITDMERGTANKADLAKISVGLSGQYARTIVQSGDIVLSVVGTIGETLKVDDNLAGINLSRAIARIQPGSSILADFIRWLFQSDPFRRYINLTCVGTAQRVLNMSDLSAFRTVLPPKPEQTEIVAFLDRETAKIDTLIDRQEKLITLLEEKRQAVISQAVTKGLDPNVTMKDSGIEWLGEIPAHWEIRKLKQTASLIDGDRSAAYPGHDDLVASGVPFYSSQQIVSHSLTPEGLKFITPEKFAELGRGKLRRGDLVITMRGTLGHTALFDDPDYSTGFINAQLDASKNLVKSALI